MMRIIRSCLPVVALILSAITSPAIAVEDGIPDALAPWVQWVVDDAPEVLCTWRHDAERVAACDWPGRLELDIDANGGKFEQRWSLQRSSWVPLPGSPEFWPYSVRANDEPVLVADRDGVPSLRLDPGDYDIRGEFRWQKAPVRLPAPRETAIVRLTVSGEERVGVGRDDNGAVILRQASARPSDSTDHLDIAVYRRLIDERPFQVHTRLALDVSGSEREVVLPVVFLDGAAPLRLEGPLPIRLLADGRLQIQVRPGRHEFDLFSRLSGPVEAVRRGAVELPLPTQEVWSFDARRALRDVRPTGLEAIDPRQTRMPGGWHDLPAFVAGPDAELRFEESVRADDMLPRDQLVLVRDVWLDFDGSGFTVRDRIDGVAHGGRRLEVGGAIELGRVVLNGEPQFITRLEARGRHGVEIRPGRLELSADARIEQTDNDLPVSGWNRDLRQVNGTLHLPPGWRLLSAAGVDQVDTAWLDAWTMLDMFMVLVLSVAVFRVWGPVAGIVAFLALGLTWQSPGAPQAVWAPLVVTSALVRYLGAGRLRAWLTSLRLAAIVAVLIVATPFLVQTARIMLFPQLEHEAGVEGTANVARFQRAMVEEVGGVAESMSIAKDAALSLPAASMPVKKRPPQQTSPNALDTALIQTGPGVPEWNWNRYRLSWNGPVDAGQSYRLVLLSPMVNRVLDLLRLLLLTLFAALLIAGRGSQRPRHGDSSVAVSWFLAPLAAVALFGAERAAAGDFPPPPLLEELRQRVIEAPACLPHCVSLESVLVTADDEFIRVFFELTVLENVAVPLLQTSDVFSPSMIEVDGSPTRMRGEESGALVPLEAGNRLVEIGGPVGSVEEVLLTFPVRPHRLAVESSTWRSSGMERAGGKDRQLRLYREVKPRTRDEQTVPSPASVFVAPFFELTRTIMLETDARVTSQLRRLSDPRAPVSLDVPLLDGESPLSGVTVRGGAVRATFAAGQSVFSWESVLKLDNPLVLTAPADANRVERWQLDASTRWHIRHQGVAPVLAGGEDGPVKVWRPWPGQQLELTLIKPEGIAGETLTIDRSRMRVTPGRATDRAALSASLRSSRGGSHLLILPEGAKVQHLRVDGEVRPFDPGSREVTVALRPGTRQVDLEWLQDGGMREWYSTPIVDLNAPSVNATLEIEPYRSRWILWVHGSSMGPAVLYWGLLIVMLLISIGMARIGWLPVTWWQWFLLGAGVAHSSLWFVLPVIGWLLLIGYRRGLDEKTRKGLFNVCQAGIVVLTPLMLAALVGAVEAGLLGDPDMQISGNGSDAGLLTWYQDRVSSTLPVATVVSAPLLVYRLLMLAWSLWLAFTVFRWLRWGWYAFNSGGCWRRVDWPWRRKESS
ncbi:MAG: hypothetical protein DWQ08_11350 [Proteobacteria bacterium]|nr:MAG: hypothetical protein DWQ08_11350 [Pseudomonadota bacterium]